MLRKEKLEIRSNTKGSKGLIVKVTRMECREVQCRHVDDKLPSNDHYYMRKYLFAAKLHPNYSTPSAVNLHAPPFCTL